MDITEKLTEVLKDRKTKGAGTSYVASLYQSGCDKILKKTAEECAEYIMAVKDGDKDHIVYEAADLIFHLYVSLVEQGIEPIDVYDELGRRFGVSGIDEKNSRTS
jgi:phosphoribosyl-ATP pyrophosphohydrolase